MPSIRCYCAQCSLVCRPHGSYCTRGSAPKGNTTRDTLKLYKGKSALALLHALLQAEVASAGMKQGTWLVHSASKLFPVLRSSLEEFDTSSREISLRYTNTLHFPVSLVRSCLASLFKLLPHACLEHTEIDLLYPALIKRLDDSIDRVRVEACATLTECVTRY